LSDSPSITLDIHTSDAPRDGVMARVEVADSHGVSLWQGETNLAPEDITTLTSDAFKSIQLWSPNTPALYTLKVVLWQGDTQLDAEERALVSATRSSVMMASISMANYFICVG
jgi:beta-galactosidase/beta-glucuronidase